MPYYDPRPVPAHGDSESTVFLVNEAPGPCEAHYGIPSVGQQGGNIYRTLRKAKIDWAIGYENFSWPILIQEDYKYPNRKQNTFVLRDAFLALRAKYMTCTNAYHLWPSSSSKSNDWVDPATDDVLSQNNIARLRTETPPHHRVILVCGEYAWKACHGSCLLQPSKHEGTALNSKELECINSRLNANFTDGWYMGHTRRWSFNTTRISNVLQSVTLAAKWHR